MATEVDRAVRRILPIKILASFFFFFFFHVATTSESSYSTGNYSGYKVYQLKTSDPLQEKMLQKLQSYEGYDFWMHSRMNTSKIMVSPDVIEEFETFLSALNISGTVVIDDVNEYIATATNEPPSSRRSMRNYKKRSFRFDRFPRYAEIVEVLKKLERRSKHATLIEIGSSFEERPILGLRIGNSVINPSIVIDGGIHAREWAAPITVLYLAVKLVENAEALAPHVTFYVIPCLNPDGYEYTHTQDRLWRKTRSANGVSMCRGVDANRNFDSHWAEVGAELQSCSGIFPGLKPFSEAETRALRDLMIEVQPVMYLTLHSYGPLILYPWGFTSQLPRNWKELDKLAREAAKALKEVNGQEYTIGSSTNVLYAASGGSDDWAMEKLGVPLVFTLELPNYGEGFEMPVAKIKPMIRETYKALQVFADYVHRKHGTEDEELPTWKWNDRNGT